MTSEIQAKIIEELEIVQDFNADNEIQRRINFLKNYLRGSGLKSFVLGISGGIDSTTAGTLAAIAVRELNDEGYPCEFIAVRLPYGTQKDADEAQEAINFIRPDDTLNINIEVPTDSLIYEDRKS